MSAKNSKIDFINKLLNNENNFQEYIDTIENQNIDIPKTLNEDISNNIKIFDCIKANTVHYKYFDILKVACFALVTVLSWELGFSKMDIIDYSKIQEKTCAVSFNNQENTIANKLGEFMMDEIIKGGEKF